MKIKSKAMEEIKTFHWIFEFPEVFLNRGGFDVVVGNPPYVDYRSIYQTERDFLNTYLPIKEPDDFELKSLSSFRNLLSFLRSICKDHSKQELYLKYLLALSDYLVYELYFKEKFAEDGIYPEPKEYLLKAVSKHLKPINYDRWAELYWKKQLEGSLTPEEEKELEELEKENMKVIEQVYNSIKSDSEIQKWIGKMKSHEWIKKIEGEI